MSSLNISREEALKEHRKMWNWIADETLKRKEAVPKEDYFNRMISIPKNLCYCCEYAYSNTPCFTTCPVYWKEGRSCINAKSEYSLWTLALVENDYIKAAELAKKIANLPER